MQLIHMQVTSADQGAARGVSVWVEDADPARAEILATQALAEAGWSLVSIDSQAETSADDYFRPCPSQQAFVRAQTETVTWRFDDE